MDIRKKKYILSAIVLLMCVMASGCSSSGKMKDGYYTAEMAEYDKGWKEYVCILVKANKIISVDFNAKNESGYIKAWDNSYMKNMGSYVDTYPNDYTRKYAAELIELQSSEGLDIVAGATQSGNNFLLLSKAVIEQAVKGDSEVAFVEKDAGVK